MSPEKISPGNITPFHLGSLPFPFLLPRLSYVHMHMSTTPCPPVSTPLQIRTFGVDQVNVRHLGYLGALLKRQLDCVPRLRAVFVVATSASESPHSASETTPRVLRYRLDDVFKVEGATLIGAAGPACSVLVVREGLTLLVQSGRR